MARREPIQYRLLPAGQVFVAAGFLLVGALAVDPGLAAPVLAGWLAIGTVQLLWPRLALRRLEVRFLPPPRAWRDGERIVLGIQVTNTSGWLRLGPVFLQPALTGRVTPLPTCEIFDVPRPGETSSWQLDFGVAVRGRHHATCQGVEILHPFALTAASLRTPHQVVALMVWCARLPVALPDTAGGRKLSIRPAAMLDRRRLLRGNEDRAQLRGYRPGDPVRAIHWRVSARAGELIVAERQQKPTPRFWLSLDTIAGGWRRGGQFERMLRVATTLAEDGFRQGVLRGIVLNGRSRRIGDRHALGVALDTLASLRLVARSASRRVPTHEGEGTLSARTRIRDILDLVPADGDKVRLVDAHGRTVLEV